MQHASTLTYNWQEVKNPRQVENLCSSYFMMRNRLQHSHHRSRSRTLPSRQARQVALHSHCSARGRGTAPLDNRPLAVTALATAGSSKVFTYVPYDVKSVQLPPLHVPFPLHSHVSAQPRNPGPYKRVRRHHVSSPRASGCSAPHLPLASLMANGDAGDAITLRIVWVAVAATVTASFGPGRRRHRQATGWRAASAKEWAKASGGEAK